MLVCRLNYGSFILYDHFRRNFQTEQRAIYRGHDIMQNPMPKPIRHDLEEYNPPSVKFETETSNKVSMKQLFVQKSYYHITAGIFYTYLGMGPGPLELGI